MEFKVGEYVKKNPVTCQPNDFDSWGRGAGVGQIVEPPFEIPSDQDDVRWPGGRCCESTHQLLPATKTLRSGNGSYQTKAAQIFCFAVLKSQHTPLLGSFAGLTCCDH